MPSVKVIDKCPPRSQVRTVHLSPHNKLDLDRRVYPVRFSGPMIPDQRALNLSQNRLSSFRQTPTSPRTALRVVIPIIFSTNGDSARGRPLVKFKGRGGDKRLLDDIDPKFAV